MIRQFAIAVTLLGLLVGCGTDTEFVEKSPESTSFKIKAMANNDLTFTGGALEFTTEQGVRHFDADTYLRPLTETEVEEGVVNVYTPYGYDYVVLWVYGYVNDGSSWGGSYTFSTPQKILYNEGSENIINVYPTYIDTYETLAVTDSYPDGCTVWTHEDTLIRGKENNVKYFAVCNEDKSETLKRGLNTVNLPGTPSEDGEVAFDDVSDECDEVELLLGWCSDYVFSDINLYDVNGRKIEKLSKTFSLLDKGSLIIEDDFLFSDAERVNLLTLCINTPDEEIDSIKFQSLAVPTDYDTDVYRTVNTFYDDLSGNTCPYLDSGIFIPKNNQLMVSYSVVGSSAFNNVEATIVEGFGNTSGFTIVAE